MWQALWFNLCPTQKGEGACLQFWLWSLKQLRCHSRLNPLMPTVAIWVHHAIKHPVADRVKQSFLILTSGHSDAQGWAVPMWQQWASKCWLWYWVCIYPSYSRTSHALAITPPPHVHYYMYNREPAVFVVCFRWQDQRQYWWFRTWTC